MSPCDVVDVAAVPERSGALLALYDSALPQVYGYLVSRCGDRALAEDLTSDTFLAAVTAPAGAPRTVGWLIGIARHKLADHWRWTARQQRLLAAVADGVDEQQDPWEARLDVLAARAVLENLTTPHRAALTLRYVDGCSLAETAALLDRTVGATEALLVRARRAFRHDYEEQSCLNGGAIRWTRCAPPSARSCPIRASPRICASAWCKPWSHHRRPNRQRSSP